MTDLINDVIGGDRGGGSVFKQGDAVMVGPFTIEQFRDTWLPGPQDNGETAILSRDGLYGVLSPDLSRLVPHSDALPAVARWLAETPDAVHDLRSIAYDAQQFYMNGDDDEASVDLAEACRSLLKALTGGEKGAGGDA